jgi:hypothetical protein
MTSSDAGESNVPQSPASPSKPPSLGYGNIYTPHAGSMIIQVQRESGLQSRTIVLGPRRVRALRFMMSRTGKIMLSVAAVVLIVLVLEAARVPALTGRISRMEHTATRLDSLERSLRELQKRYDQVRVMMGADSSAAAKAQFASRAATPMPANPPRLGTPVAPDADSSAPAIGTAATTDGADESKSVEVTPARSRSRRHRIVAAPAPTDSEPPATAPDSGAPPSTQAEPQ